MFLNFCVNLKQFMSFLCVFLIIFMNLMMNLVSIIIFIWYTIFIFILIFRLGLTPRFATRLTPPEAKGKRLKTRFRSFKPCW
ncbi:hypothetical protein Hanom_Chr07g00627161 [Helianthus anomalus]